MKQRKLHILKRRKSRRKSSVRSWPMLAGGLTVLLLLFIVVHRSCSASTDDELDITATPLWSDTLTNAASDLAQFAPMDRQIENFMARQGIKGMSVAVSRHDSLVYAKGYGWADKEAGKKMTPKSMMRIASASKLITAIAVMKLVDEGKLSLNSKVFGPDGIIKDKSINAALGDPRMKDITVDQLLMHKAGFTNGRGDPMFSIQDIIKQNKLSGAPTAEELAAIVLRRRLGYQPGKGRRYSNFGYLLLSMVVERVSGESYWDYVKDHILEPAGAVNFRPATNYYEDRHAGEVKYYGQDTSTVEEYNGSGRRVQRVYGGNDINGLQGAGGWIAAAPDLLRVVNSVDGLPEVGNLLSENSINTMTTDGGKENLTRGWALIDEDGSWVRTGTLGSSHAYIHRFPNGDCWVVLTNTGHWRGARFSRDLANLVKSLNRQYGNAFPHRTLW